VSRIVSNSTWGKSASSLGAEGRFFLPFLAAAVIAFVGIGPIRTALELYDLAYLANPYFVPAQAVLLYGVVPVVTIALAIFLLAPGLMLSAAIGREKSLAQWLLSGLALSMALLVAAVTLFQLSTGIVLRGHAFLWLVATVSAAVLPFPMRRIVTGKPLAVNFQAQRLDLAFALIVPVVTILAFSAKYYWENFTPDGSGGLQFARLYLSTLWPFWPDSAGTVKQAPDLTSMLFVVPGSWFLRTIGEYEYAVRAPMLLYLGLLHPLLIALIRAGRREAARIGLADHLLVAAILLLFTLVTVYSGGYHPWFNDSPMPAVRESLALVAFLGYMLFFVERRIGWMIAFAVLSYTSIPTGSLWILAIPAASWLVWRDATRPPLTPAFLTFFGVAAFAVGAPFVIRAVGLPMPGSEFGLHETINRIRYVSFADWNRIAFLLVPGAIVPAAALFLWRRQDGMSRMVTVVTAVMFLFFWFQAYRVLLHHFVPAMLLPVIVYWRSVVLPAKNAIPARLAVLAGIFAATWLAWPGEMRLHTADRELGAKMLTRGPVFETVLPVDGERFHGFNPVALDVAHDLLHKAFPPNYAPSAPSAHFFGGPHVWYFYSRFPKPPRFIPEYDIRPLTMPGQGTLVAQHLGYGMYIRDMAEYARDKTRKLPYNTGSPLLSTDRDVIFGRGARYGNRIVIDLVDIARWALGRHVPRSTHP